MLGSAVPATASIHTSTSSATPTSPTRPSRLRGLSYLRSYTRDHLHSSTSIRPEAPQLRRSTSNPARGSPQAASPSDDSRLYLCERNQEGAASGIQNGEQGWLPTVQGRSGLSRDSLHPTSTSTESASPEPSNLGMTRSRAATAIGPTPTTSLPSGRQQSAAEATSADMFASSTAPEASGNGTSSKDALPTIRFIPHVEPRSTRPSLNFTALTRTLKSPDCIVRVGRYSERDNSHPGPNTLPVGFKSKVVSRRHCELWCSNNQWYIKDVKSSSGTFLNHVRLSPPGQESRPYEVNDGDTVQLGIDFKGGEEVIFRCVKIRIECNRGWQKSLNAYNTTAHKRLLKSALQKKSRDSDAASVNSSECSICLNPVAPCQALFVAPCSHVWHYKCVRNLIHGPHYPNFLCPNCRFVADLEADVEPPEEEEDWEGVDLEDGDVDVQAGEEQYGNGESESRRRRDDTEVGEEQQHHSSSSDEAEQRSPVAERGANITDEELAGLLTQTSLQSSVRRSSNAATSPPRPLLASPEMPNDSISAGRFTAVTQPVTIRHPASSLNQRSPSSDLLGARSTTPTSNTQFALAAGIMSDGPMTPRNDAGPFVLDGSAGRHRVGIAGEVVREESEPPSPPDER